MTFPLSKKHIWMLAAAFAIIAAALYGFTSGGREPDFIENMGGAANIEDDLIDLNQPSR